jgi:rhodanese-related sulfurtransferase
MLSPSYSISPNDLWRLIGTAHAPQLVDVCRRDIYDSRAGQLPASTWQDPSEFARWSPALDRQRPIVVACKAGKELSQFITAELREAGFSASMLEGGFAAWSETGLPLVDR